MRRRMKIALAVAAGALLAAPASARRSAMSNTPEIALVADLPDDARFQAFGPDGSPVTLDLGWSYREFSAFWMPFAAWREQGFVFYSQSPDGTMNVALATRNELLAIKQLTSKDYEKDFHYPYWQHYWGWIPVLALLGYVWWLWRRERRRKDAEGIM